MTTQASGVTKQGTAGVALTVAGLTALCLFAFLPPGRTIEEAKDFLDSIMVWYWLRGDQTGYFFDYNHIVPNVFGGLPLNTFPFSDLTIGLAFFDWMDGFLAYSMNQFLLRALAYAGMYLLVRDHVFCRQPHARFYAAVAAFSFAVIPHQIWGMGTAMALPLAVWGFANVWKGTQGPYSYAAIFFYPFYSFVVYGALQVYGYAAIAAAIAYFRSRQNFRTLILTLGALAIVVLVVESRLIYHWFFATYDYVSQRSLSPRLGSSRSFSEEFLQSFVLGTEALYMPSHFPFVPAVMILGMVAGGVSWWRVGAAYSEKRSIRLVCWLLLSGIAIGLFIAFERRAYLFQSLFGIPFSLGRAEAPYPVLWWIIFVLSIHLIYTSRLWGGRFVALVAMFATVAHLTLQFPGMKYEVKEALGLPQHLGLRATVVAALGLDSLVGHPRYARFLGTAAPMYVPDQPLGNDGPLQRFRQQGDYRFADYYDSATMPALKAAMFDALKLAQPDYRVLTINLSSAIAIYNGFYTPNAYLGDNPAAAGQRYLDLFAGEFAKDGLAVPLADRNGIEAYVSRKSLATDGQSITLALNVDSLRELDIRAVFSYLPINNAATLGLAHLGHFGHIHAYIVSPP